jgi:hypothetical protein
MVDKAKDPKAVTSDKEKEKSAQKIVVPKGKHSFECGGLFCFFSYIFA